jgi:hypothetical protein
MTRSEIPTSAEALIRYSLSSIAETTATEGGGRRDTPKKSLSEWH